MTLTNVAGKEGAPTDERALVEAARHDHTAFDQLYRRYATRVYRYCYTHTNNARDAEDLTTQTFMAAMEGISRFRGRGSFAAWLFAIAWRKCKDYHRRRYQMPQETLQRAEQMPDAELPDLEQRAYQQDILDCVQQTWSLLSEDRQEVVRLRFWGGLNTEETAAVMGRSKGAVKMLLARAIADLRERCLDE